MRHKARNGADHPIPTFSGPGEGGKARLEEKGRLDRKRIGTCSEEKGRLSGREKELDQPEEKGRPVLKKKGDLTGRGKRLVWKKKKGCTEEDRGLSGRERKAAGKKKGACSEEKGRPSRRERKT